MHMDSEMISILLSDSMHYTIVVSLEMSDEPPYSVGCGLLVIGCGLLVVGSFVWKTIPSRARVTRDEVSGL